MHAVAVFTFGDPDVLQVADVPTREPKPGEVRIRVAAAAVNPVDLLMRSGAHADYFARFERPHILGMDAAGTIEAVGEGVDRLSVGDRVMACVSPFRPEGGAYQEPLVAKAASVVPIPAGASFEQAATLPMNGMTATAALDALQLPKGATLLVTGGTGWLAALALPLAKARGLRTIADARHDEHDLATSWGADEVVDRGSGLVERIRALAPGGVDGVLDTALVGTALLPAIRDAGGWAVVRPEEVCETERGIVCHGVNVSPRFGDTEALFRLRDLASAGRLPMRVAETYPPERAAEAHRRQAAGGVRGRLVIRF